MNDEALQCKICHKEFDHLGSHIVKRHGITAREYKIQFGLDFKFPLISERVKAKKRAHFEKRRAYYLKNFLKAGKKYQFTKGHDGTHRVSAQSKTRYAKQSEAIEEMEKGICPVCKMGFDHIDSHLYNAHGLKRA